MATTNGEKSVLYLKKGDNYFPVALLTSNSFSESAETIPTTTRDVQDGWQTSRAVSQSYSISFNGFVDSETEIDGKISYQDMQIFKRSRQVINWRIDKGDDNYDYGFGIITELSKDANIDELIAFTANIQGYGEPENLYDRVYFGYKERVELLDSLVSEACVKSSVGNLVDGGYLDDTVLALPRGGGIGDGVLYTMIPNTTAGDFTYTGTGQTRIDENGDTIAVADNTPPISYEFGVDECPVLKLAGDAVCQGAQFEDVASGGVWKIQLAALSNDGTDRYSTLSNGTGNEQLRVRFVSTDNVFRVMYINGGVVGGVNYTLPDATDFNDYWVKWEKTSGDVGNIEFKVNGIQVWKIEGVNLATVLNNQDFHNGSGAQNMIAKVGQNTISNNLDDFNTAFKTVDEMATFAKFNKQ